MPRTVSKKHADSFDEEAAIESLKRMIRYTKTESDKDGRTFCSYFLDMALQSLEEGSKELDIALKAKVTPLVIGENKLDDAHA